MKVIKWLAWCYRFALNNDLVEVGRFDYNKNKIPECRTVERRMNMKKNEKLNEKESFGLGVYIAGLYEKCDGRKEKEWIY